MEFVIDKMKECVYQIHEYYRPDPERLARSLLALDIFSDLTITCGEKEWKVHKNVLWIQSDYFRKLLNGNFKVRKINGNDRVHPSWCTSPTPSKDFSREKTPSQPTKEKHQNLTRYLTQEAKASTIDLSRDDPHALEILIHYFYNFRLPSPLTSNASTTPLPTLLVKIYAIADKYDVQPLLTLARDQPCEIYSPSFVITNIPAFVNCVRAVDEHTRDEPESHGGLRGILLHAACANMGRLVKSEVFRELLQDAPEVVVALLELQIVSHDQAWKISEADEAAARLEGERVKARVRGGWEVSQIGGSAAWPMD